MFIASSSTCIYSSGIPYSISLFLIPIASDILPFPFPVTIICFAIFKKQLYQKKNGGLQCFCGIRQLPIFPHSAARSHGVAAGAAALCSLPSAAPLRCIRHWRRSAPLSLQPRRFAPWLATWLEKSGCCRASQKETPYEVGCFFFVGSGSYLSFRAVASQVLSAYKGLTSVFGMGTGGTP